MPKSKIVHGSAKAPPPKTSTASTKPTFTSQNTSRAKLIRMGRHPEVSSGGAKTRP